MIKIYFSEARSRFLKGEEVVLCPSNCCPDFSHPFNSGVRVQSTEGAWREEERVKEWNRINNEFKYYNCDSERGNSVHYYKEV